MPAKSWVSLILLITIGVGLSALWRWSALADRFSVAALASWAVELKRSPLTPVWVLGAYVIAGQIFFPITVLSLATVLTFGPVVGTLYSTVGALLAGVVTYFIGRCLGEARLYRLAGPRIDKLRRQLQRHGLATSVTIHILPLAPFTLVNLFSGASGLRLRHFVIGTFIGHLPGALSIIIFERQLRRVLRSPDPMNIALLVLFLAVLSAGILWLYAYSRKRTASAT